MVDQPPALPAVSTDDGSPLAHRAASRPQIHPAEHLVGRIVRLLFDAFLVLALLTPAWRAGVFTWWPILRLPMLAGRPATLGLLSLLPLLILAGWTAWRLFSRTSGRRWTWGRAGITAALLGLSLLMLAGLEWTPSWRTSVQLGGLALLWLVYLFVLNQRPGLAAPLAVVVVVQSAVAIGQFLQQGSLGLAALGEPALDPTVEGVSVLFAGGQPWLRAYGLTGHPNALGAMLAVLLLMSLDSLYLQHGGRRIALVAVVAVGVLGLLASFSRTAWLAFAAGLVVWIGARWLNRQRMQPGGESEPGRAGRWLVYLLPAVVAMAFVWLYRGLVASRFLHLDTPIEATSLADRQRDAALALRLAATHPWRGVGSSNYLAAAQAIDAAARTVHNVPLLVAAELGLPGLLLLLWLGMAPFVSASGRRVRLRLPANAAPWVAMLVIGLFDVTLWPGASWHAAILLGLVAAWQSRAAPSPILGTGELRSPGAKRRGGSGGLRKDALVIAPEPSNQEGVPAGSRRQQK